MQKQRKLAFVIHDLNSWGGHDRSTLEIARRLSHRWPVEIHAFTLNDPRGLESWGEVSFHQIRPNIAHPVMAKMAWFYGATLPGLRMSPALRRETPALIHATGACSLVSDVVQVQFVSAAWKKIRNKLPAGSIQDPGWVRRLYHETLLSFNAAVEHQVYTRDKTYIAIAHCVADELRDYFGITDRIHVIHHGVDSEVFCPAGYRPGTSEKRKNLRSSLGIEHDEVVGLFVGTYERKGLASAIDALSYLSEPARKKFKLLAVGDGPVEAFKKRAKDAGVSDRVIFHSHTRDIVPFYQASDLFVLPTYYEPFGLVILEALSSGLPSVVSRIAGGSELIRDRESGMLIQDPTDSREIAGLLEPLVVNSEYRSEVSSNARKVGVNRSWDKVADEYAEVLSPLLSEVESNPMRKKAS